MTPPRTPLTVTARSVRSLIRKPMPRKPPKIEVPKTVYRRRPKHVGATDA